MFRCATSVVLLATLALCTSAPSSHDQYVDELLQHLQAAYGKTSTEQGTSYNDRHVVTATGETQEAPQANEQNEQQTRSGYGNKGNMLKRANYIGPMKRPPNTFFYRQDKHAPRFGQLAQLDESIKLAKEDEDHASSKRQTVDHSLVHVLNKANNYGVTSNSRQNRNVPEFAELQESGASNAGGDKVDGKLGHVLNKENHYGMLSSDEKQPAALTAHGNTRGPDNQTRATSQHAPASSAQRRGTFWKQLPDKMYKNPVQKYV